MKLQLLSHTNGEMDYTLGEIIFQSPVYMGKENVDRIHTLPYECLVKLSINDLLIRFDLLS